MALRAALSHEMVEQIRYRTREGMKTAVGKGKAATCLAYGYVLSQQRDANGDRIKGLRISIQPRQRSCVGFSGSTPMAYRPRILQAF
nr:recombinase family protein [Rhizobium sp. Q54]